MDLEIKVITILGANGSMGKNIAAIFASFGNAKVYLACRDEEKSQKAVIEAYQSVRSESIKSRLIPITYDNLKEAISESDLIFESLAENMSLKIEMYNKIKLYLKENAIIATGTSGLSIKDLAKAFEINGNNFFGIHMFNPPYNLPLCELIIHNEKQLELSNKLEKYLTNVLKRVVIKVKDKPAFLGNRIGFFFINEALKLAEQNADEGGIDYIDAILGCFTGRIMTPLVTAEFVGLDITKAIEDYIFFNTTDMFKNSFKLPSYVNHIINQGYIGKKTQKGLFYFDKETKMNYVYDIKQDSYRLKQNYQFYFANEMIKNIRIGNYIEAINILIKDKSKEACICKKMILKYVIYSIYISKSVAYKTEYCDDAMATGFSWLPPLAWIELFGGKDKVKYLINEYLDEEYIFLVNTENIFEGISNESKYDYRSFLKAKY